MSALEQETEQPNEQPFELRPTYEEWWATQVCAVLPRWSPGTWRYGYQDGHVYWPMHGEPLVSRLTHLASLRAHS